MSGWAMAAKAGFDALSKASNTNISQAAASTSGFSGGDIFENDDVISMSSGRLIDFSDFKSVAIAAAVIVVAIYVIKKNKR